MYCELAGQHTMASTNSASTTYDLTRVDRAESGATVGHEVQLPQEEAVATNHVDRLVPQASGPTTYIVLPTGTGALLARTKTDSPLDLALCGCRVLAWLRIACWWTTCERLRVHHYLPTEVPRVWRIPNGVCCKHVVAAYVIASREPSMHRPAVTVYQVVPIEAES